MTSFRFQFQIARSVLIVLSSFAGCAADDAASSAPTPPSTSARQDAATDVTMLIPGVALGARFVDARGCPLCHQSSDSADGVLSGQDSPRPGTRAYGRNLTPDNDTGIGTWADEVLLRAIRSGVNDQGVPLCTPMPHFHDMPDAEGDAIIAYLRSLPPVKREIPDSECSGTDNHPDGAAPAPPDAGFDASDAEAPADASVAGDAGMTIADAGADAACAMLAPDTVGSCHGCTIVSRCHANGCYGGLWCAPATNTCHRRPVNCRPKGPVILSPVPLRGGQLGASLPHAPQTP